MKKLITVVFLSMLVGCAINTTDENTNPSSNILQVIDEFKKESQQGVSLYDLYDPSGVNPGFTTWENKYPAYQRWWCTDDTKAKVNLTDRVVQYCQALGGEYVSSWCHSNSKEGPLFMVWIGKADIVEKPTSVPFCKAGYDIGVKAVTSEGALDFGSWTTWAHDDLGYKTVGQRAAENERLNSRATMLALAEESKKDENAKLILSSSRGTKICKNDGDIFFVGFIEESVNEKIKILVSDAMYKNMNNLRPGGFKQHITWDLARNWWVCP